MNAPSVMRVTIGIDQGLTGAIAVLADGRFVSVDDMPVAGRGAKGKQQVNAARLAAIVRGAVQAFPGAAVTAFVEFVHSMPKQGVSSAFGFGKSVGAVEGVLATLGIPTEELKPQRWKKDYGLIGAEKNASIGVAALRFPSAPLSLKKHHGRADALLMAFCGYRDETAKF